MNSATGPGPSCDERETRVSDHNHRSRYTRPRTGSNQPRPGPFLCRPPAGCGRNTVAIGAPLRRVERPRSTPFIPWSRTTSYRLQIAAMDERGRSSYAEPRIRHRMPTAPGPPSANPGIFVTTGALICGIIRVVAVFRVNWIFGGHSYGTFLHEARTRLFHSAGDPLRLRLVDDDPIGRRDHGIYLPRRFLGLLPGQDRAEHPGRRLEGDGL